MPKATHDAEKSKRGVPAEPKRNTPAVKPPDFALSDTPGIVENDGTSYGVCHVCEWRGEGRRSREKARRDAAEHYLLAH